MADLAGSTGSIDGFFRRWEASGAAERANYSMFLNELCDLLDVPRPDPAGPDDTRNAYVFERAVPFPNPDGTTTVKRIDLYKRDCFVLEAKQGSDRVEAAEPLSLAPLRRMRRGTGVERVTHFMAPRRRGWPLSPRPQRSLRIVILATSG